MHLDADDEEYIAEQGITEAEKNDRYDFISEVQLVSQSDDDEYHIIDFSNRLLSRLPRSLTNLPNFELNISGNSFSELPNFNLPNVEALDISSNPLSQEAINARIRNFTNLDSLTIKNLNLSELPSEINGMHILKILDISDNKFTKIPDAATKLPNLKWLAMRNNLLLSLPNEQDWKNFSSLEEVDIDGNFLEDLPSCFRSEGVGKWINSNDKDFKDIEEFQELLDGRTKILIRYNPGNTPHSAFVTGGEEHPLIGEPLILDLVRDSENPFVKAVARRLEEPVHYYDKNKQLSLGVELNAEQIGWLQEKTSLVQAIFDAPPETRSSLFQEEWEKSDKYKRLQINRGGNWETSSLPAGEYKIKISGFNEDYIFCRLLDQPASHAIYRFMRKDLPHQDVAVEDNGYLTMKDDGEIDIFLKFPQTHEESMGHSRRQSQHENRDVAETKTPSPQRAAPDDGLSSSGASDALSSPPNSDVEMMEGIEGGAEQTRPRRLAAIRADEALLRLRPTSQRHPGGPSQRGGRK